MAVTWVPSNPKLETVRSRVLSNIKHLQSVSMDWYRSVFLSSTRFREKYATWESVIQSGNKEIRKLGLNFDSAVESLIESVREFEETLSPKEQQWWHPFNRTLLPIHWDPQNPSLADVNGYHDPQGIPIVGSYEPWVFNVPDTQDKFLDTFDLEEAIPLIDHYFSDFVLGSFWDKQPGQYFQVEDLCTSVYEEVRATVQKIQNNNRISVMIQRNMILCISFFFMKFLNEIVSYHNSNSSKRFFDEIAEVLFDGVLPLNLDREPWAFGDSIFFDGIPSILSNLSLEFVQTVCGYRYAQVPESMCVDFLFHIFHLVAKFSIKQLAKIRQNPSLASDARIPLYGEIESYLVISAWLINKEMKRWKKILHWK